MKHKNVNKKNSNRSQYKNQVKIEFTSKPITAWGGICGLIGKYLEEIEFRDWVKNNLPIEETSPNGRGIYEKVLGQFLTSLTGGYRFSHMQRWGHGDEAIKKSFGVEWLPEAPSSLTRFWRKIENQGLSEEVGRAARHLTCKLLQKERIREDNLNLDSSICVRYGQQDGAKRGYNPKKHGRPSHHPLIAFIGSGYVVNLWNRSGNTSSSHQDVVFYEQTVKSLPEDFKIRRTLADSGFYNVDFIEYLEGQEQHYIISAPISRILQKEILKLKKWETVERGIEVGEFYFEHFDKKWTKARRYAVVRQQIEERPKAPGKQLYLLKEFEVTKSYRYSLMITNDEESKPVEIWREYRPRAKDENVIKDMKEGYGMAAFNMKSFWATEAVMLMNALVFHNLIHFLNRNILNPGGVIEQMKTLRMKYFIIPAQLGSRSGMAVLRLGVKDKSLQGKIRYWLNKIAAFSFTLNCNAVVG